MHSIRTNRIAKLPQQLRAQHLLRVFDCKFMCRGEHSDHYLINQNIFDSKRTEPSHSLDLKFTDFDLELTDRCIDDYVQVYDGHEKRADKMLLGRTCGTRMPNEMLRSDSNELLVVMQSDFHIEAKGFMAEFEVACGAKINTSGSGILEIGHNLRWSVEDCRWTIRAENPSTKRSTEEGEMRF